MAKQWRQALALAAADDSPVDEDTADASVLGHLTLEEVRAAADREIALLFGRAFGLPREES